MFIGFPSLGLFDDMNSNLNQFIEKLEKGKLTLEDILKEDIIMQDIKTNNNSKFIDFLTNEKIKKLIDYSTKFPSQDDHNIGYKYPFNATEILCLDNNINFQNIFLTEKIYKSNEDLDDKEAIKKIQKGGFIFELFNAINKNNLITKNGNKKEEQEDENEDDDESEEDEEEEKKSEENEKIGKKDEKREENQKIIYENVDYLLNFLKESDKTKENYVLVGYFYKI